jgi:aquaporin Z
MTIDRADQTTTTRGQRMLRGASTPDFLESAHEWRRLFAESWGTFLLVVVAAGARVVGAQSDGAITLSMSHGGRYRATGEVLFAPPTQSLARLKIP